MNKKTLKNKPKIIVDTREKKGWDWESDANFSGVEYRKLHAGDYSLEGLEDVIMIERKASVDELYINFCKADAKRRIFAEFERAEDYEIKILVIEQSAEDIFNPYKYFVNKKKIHKGNVRVPVAIVAENLTKLMVEYGVQVIFGGDKAQSIVRGILLHTWKIYETVGD